jgi:hypothetical protein
VPQPVSISAGTTLTIRIDQYISVKTSRAGDTFPGEMVDHERIVKILSTCSDGKV